jgi:hypothetical protein
MLVTALDQFYVRTMCVTWRFAVIIVFMKKRGAFVSVPFDTMIIHLRYWSTDSDI